MSAKRVDANQAEIVADLRQVGAFVQHLHEVGDGCPDLAVAYHGNYLFEVKTEDGKLTEKQVEWHARWKEAGGQVDVIETSREAFVIMGLGWEEGDDYGEEADDEGVGLDGEPYAYHRHYEEEPDEGDETAYRDGVPRGTLFC